MVTSRRRSQGARAPCGPDLAILNPSFGGERAISPSESGGLPAVGDRVNILGVGAMPLDLKRAVATLERWRAERRQEYVCVVSVHGLVVAQRDPVIRHALNHCGMATEDGMPLVWWSQLAGFRQGAASVALICSTRCALSACRTNSATTSMGPAKRSSKNWSRDWKSVILASAWRAIARLRSGV